MVVVNVLDGIVGRCLAVLAAVTDSVELFDSRAFELCLMVLTESYLAPLVQFWYVNRALAEALSVTPVELALSVALGSESL